jgi:hypothetical protein
VSVAGRHDLALIEKTLAALPNGEAAFAAAATEPGAAAYLT